MADDAVKVAKLEVEISYKTKGDPQKEINKAKKALNNLGKESEKSSTKVNKMFESLKRIATYRLLRTALKEISQGFKEGITNLLAWEKVTGNTNALKVVNTLSGKLLELKNAMGAAVVPPMLEALLPIIQRIADGIINIANAINQTIRALQGYSTYTKANTISNYDYAKSIKTVTKQLLGFDEINKLNDNNMGNGGVAYADMFKQTNIGDMFVDISAKIKDSLKELMGVAALSMGAIGLILCFTGHLTAGVPMLIGSFATTIAAIEWNGTTEQIRNNLDKILGFAAVSTLAIGLMIACLSPANMALGLGLVVAGATGLAAKAALSDGTKDVKDKIATLGAIVSGATIALGAILVATGANIPLGIGLLVAGAVGLVASASISDGTKGIKTKISELSVIMGGASLVLGAILFFTGANPALGLGLMLAGAVGLASAIAINWDWIKQQMGSIVDWFQTKFQALEDWWTSTALYKFLHGDNVVGNALDTAKSEGFGFGLGYGYMYGGNGYAEGGYPPQGTYFYAGENGDPEFVGNVGGRTAVYNSDQLAGSLASANEMVVDAIYQAVSAINSAIANQPVPSIKIGDREIYQATERGRRTIGGSLVQGV